MSELNFVPKFEFERVLEIQNAPVPQCELFSTLCRINTLYMISHAGSGHLGSSFSSLDIVAWLYLNELCGYPDKGGEGTDVFFSSKGHDVPGLYSVLIGLGLLPFQKIHALRRLNGLPGHPDISTPHIAVNTGSLGMGISKAKGIILADRQNQCHRHIFVMTGDGELQEGQIWESLQGAANAKMNELTVIVDHNKIQSDHWISDTSPLGNIESRFEAFGWKVQRCDGHKHAAIDACLKACRQQPGPTVIIADTIKGQGVSFMEPGDLGHLDFYEYHSGAPSMEEYKRAMHQLEASANKQLRDLKLHPLKLEVQPSTSHKTPAPKPETLISAYSSAIVDLGKRNDRITVLDADLVLDCGLVEFRKTFPDRYIECGISEMDMVSQAGGLALGGKVPVVHSFACFLTARANEQIYANATEKTKIIYVGSLAGLLPAGTGHSHQSVRDIALMSCVPNMTVFEPCCPDEMVKALNWMVENVEGPSYLRLTSIPPSVPIEWTDSLIVPGRGTILRPGTDALVIGYGPIMLAEAHRAAEFLYEQHKINVQIINLPWLSYIDSVWLCEEVKSFDYVFTIDNHYLVGGQGEKVSSAILALNLNKPPHIERFGIEEIPACGNNLEVLNYHELDSAHLSSKIFATITGKPVSK